MPTRRQCTGWLTTVAFGQAVWPAWAQETAGVNREQVPLDEASEPFSAPARSLLPSMDDVQVVECPNGMQLTVVSRASRSLSDVSMSIGVSPLDDDPGQQGLAEAAASLLPSCSATGSDLTLAQMLRRIGATISSRAAYSSESTEISIRVLQNGSSSALQCLFETIRTPRVSQAAVNQWKKQKEAELVRKRSDPRHLAERALRQALYPGDNRGVLEPSEQFVARVTSEHVQDFYRTRYLPRNSVLGISTVERSRDVYRRVAALSGSWKSPDDVRRPALGLDSPIIEPSVRIINMPGRPSVSLWMGNRAFNFSSPDYPTGAILGRMLGLGPSSRLYHTLRGRLGYVYEVFAGFTAHRYLGHFSALTQVEPAKTAAVLESILAECRSLQRSPVSRPEMEAAKRGLFGALLRELDAPADRLALAMIVARYRLPKDHWRHYFARIDRLSSADVMQAAKRYLPVDNPQIVAVGEADKLVQPLHAFGPVEVS